MSLDISGAHMRAASEKAGHWEIKPELSPHLFIKDREAAAKNPVVVFSYSKPAARVPSMRWATREDLKDPGQCALMDLVGIDKKMRETALRMFEPSNIIKLDRPARKDHDVSGPAQMTAQSEPMFNMKG